MGGFGSGDWADVTTRKIHTGLCLSLSVNTLKKMGVFDAWHNQYSIQWTNELGEDAGKVSIIPQVRSSGNGNKTSLRTDIGGFVTGQDISITTTPCFYGGVRNWFLCPASVDGVLCENRVGMLYLQPGGKVFACRHCYGLTYESSQQNHKYDRVAEHLEGLDEENLTINKVLRLGGL